MSRAETRPHPANLWTAADVQRLPVIGRRTLDYAWTGPDVNPAGVTIFEPAVWSARIGEHHFSGETVIDMLVDNGFVIFDKETQEVFVNRWFSFHKFDGPVGKKALRRGIREVRSSSILTEILRLAALAGIDVNEINGVSDNSNNNNNSKKTAAADAALVVRFVEENSGFLLGDQIVEDVGALLTSTWRTHPASDRHTDTACATQFLRKIDDEISKMGWSGWEIPDEFYDKAFSTVRASRFPSQLLKY